MESVYPALNREAFLIEHACVPRFYPSYCAEAAQILAEIERRRLSLQSHEGGSKDVSG